MRKQIAKPSPSDLFHQRVSLFSYVQELKAPAGASYVLRLKAANDVEGRMAA
ncbi:MAG: hypothetical protein PHU06_02875 [Gallionella sp.]|nr:hypothetical protein [Gallionella sp.]